MSVTIQLKYPVKQKLAKGEEREISEVTLERPKAKHLKGSELERGDVGKTVKLISMLSGLPLAVIEELDSQDMLAIGEEVDRMMGKPQAPQTSDAS